MLTEAISATEIELRACVVSAARRLYERGLVAGAEGNVSVRLDTEWMLVTPAGVSKGTLAPDDIVRASLQSESNSVRDEKGRGGDIAHRDNRARASSEVEMHRTLYAARADVGAVVHAHPPVATGFATSGRPIPANVLAEFPAVVGPIALVPYARPGTQALSDAMRPWIAAHEVFLLANHGVTTVGRTLESALQRMESVEQGARSIFVAQLLGGALALPAGEAEALSAIRLATQVTNASNIKFVLSANLDQD